MVSLLICSFLMSNNPADAWTHNIVLGRPTNQSITASVMFDTVAVFYLEYGTQSGLYSAQTPVFNAQSNTPEEVEISGLSGDTKYYYRLRYSVSSSTPNTTGAEHIFHTQRAPGQGFTFTVEADEHLYDKKGVASLYHLTLANQLADNPDFMLSLGDIF
jgi:phosphodiesterase/alkaline phosphatase D-like protein